MGMGREIFLLRRKQPGSYAVEQLSDETIAENIQPISRDDDKVMLGIGLDCRDFQFESDTVRLVPIIKRSGYNSPFDASARACEFPRSIDEISSNLYIAIVQLKDGVTLQQLADTWTGFAGVIALCDTFDSYAPA